MSLFSGFASAPRLFPALGRDRVPTYPAFNVPNYLALTRLPLGPPPWRHNISALTLFVFLAFRRLCLFRADSSCQASRNLLSNHSKFEIPCLSQRLWLSPRPSRAPRQLLASGSRASFFSDVYPRRVLTVNPAACLQLPLQRPCFALQPSLHPVVSHGF